MKAAMPDSRRWMQAIGKGALTGLVGLTLGLTTSATALDLSLPDLGRPASDTLSLGEEARMGQEMMREIRRRITLVEDPAVNAYIRDLGGRIASVSDRPAGFYRFFVIDDDRINAFALPGGYIGLNSGLIVQGRTESELGGVIAHEVAHITQRHIARRMEVAERTGVRTAALVLAGLLIGTQDPQAGMATATTGMAAGLDTQLRYSRQHELEADRVGIRMLADAELNPDGMADFFELLDEESRYRSAAPAFLSTHPLTEMRLAEARERGESLGSGTPFESPDHAYIRARLQVQAADQAEDALARFNDTLEDDPSDPGARYGLALALIRDNRPDEAIEQLQALKDAVGDHALHYLGLAEAEKAARRDDQAVVWIEEGLSLFPGDEALRYTLAEVRLLADEPHQAARVSRRLVGERSDAPELWALHARATRAAGDEAAAILATARFYAVQADFEAGLSQLDRLDGLPLTSRQRAQADDLRERWRDRLGRRD